MEKSDHPGSGPQTAAAPPDNRPLPAAMASAVGQIPFWRRFHVQTSGLFGGVVLLVLTLMSASFYLLQSQNQVRALKNQLLTEVRALSHRIRPQALLALNSEPDWTKSEYAELVKLFTAVAVDQPGIVSVYVFRPTDRPNILAFAAD
jgi:hypothetical protein